MQRFVLVILLLAIIPIQAFGQEIIKARQFPVSLIFLPNIQPARADLIKTSEDKKIAKKSEQLLTLDISFPTLWAVVDVRRIYNVTIQSGAFLEPWEDSVKFQEWPIPAFKAVTKNTLFRADADILNVRDRGLVRRADQIELGAEGGWWGLIGISGFFSQETILGAIRGLSYDADFRRQSYGGNAWVGVKVGNFTKHFLLARYGRGYIGTRGDFMFRIVDADKVEWLPIYFEEFYTESFSVKETTRIKWVSQSIEVENIRYTRVVFSPNPAVFGKNKLEELIIRGELEFTPWSKYDKLRLLVVGTKDLRNRERLLFRNEPASVRALLRIAFR